MSGKNKSKFDFLIKTFDVMFVMTLCFLTLLTTMILRGSVIVGSNSSSKMTYSFNIIYFLVTFVGLILYLFYIIPRSDKELRGMINELYSNDSDKQE